MSKKPKQGTDLLYTLIAQARTYPDTIIMGRGDPDFDTPPHIRAAAIEAMKSHGNDYSPAEGILSLRQAIADRVKRLNGIDVAPETEVVVTNGGQEALFLMVVTAIGPGEELIIPEPNYNTYADALNFAGGVKAAVPTYASEDFRVDPDRVQQAITPRSRGLLLVSPNNPTANVITQQDMQRLVALAEEHDLILLADDIYDLFMYDGHEHVSTASLPGAKERTLTLNALSKAFSMTGWRCGWVVGPAPLMAQLKELKAAINAAPPIVAQHAALAALTGPDGDVERMRRTYLRRRAVVLEALDAMGLQYGMPHGGQFVFVDIANTGVGCVELVQRILDEQHVLVYPGSSFAAGLDNYLRMTFLQPEDKLREGLARMKIVMDKVFAEKGAQ
jgi:aminotransferase